jgi:hypothetical protein
MIKHHDIAELVVAAEMIQMSMRVDHGHGMASQQLNGSPQISNAATRVNEYGVLVANEQVEYGMLIVARFRDGIEIVADLLDFEPIIVNSDAMWLREISQGSRRLGQFVQHSHSDYAMLLSSQIKRKIARKWQEP